jgi:hypothetical protein
MKLSTRTLYATVTLSSERLEVAAESRGLILDVSWLGGTGFHPQRFDENGIAQLKPKFEDVHAGRSTSATDVDVLGDQLLDAVFKHFGRSPRPLIGEVDPRGHARIVARARAYIFENLSRPLRIDEVAKVSISSRRTLYRAFNQVLDETPHSYVRKLRLHRIRQDLASDST